MDAARSFGTGCFKEHRTHDLRGLSESEIHVSTQYSPPFSPKKLGDVLGKGEEPHFSWPISTCLTTITCLFFLLLPF